MTEATIAAPSLCETVSTLLSMQLGTGEGELRVDARDSSGIGHAAFAAQAVAPGLLPIDVLLALENNMHIRVSPAVRRDGNRGLLRLSVLFARWILVPVFDGTEWGLPADQQLAIANRIALFPCPPTAVIDGGGEVVALWRLDASLDLTTAAGLARARRAQADLAAALGASTQPMDHTTPSASGGPTRVETFDAHDPAGYIPLCGIVRERIGNALAGVTIPRLNLAHTYTIEQIEAASQKEITS